MEMYEQAGNVSLKRQGYTVCVRNYSSIIGHLSSKLCLLFSFMVFAFEGHFLVLTTNCL